MDFFYHYLGADRNPSVPVSRKKSVDTPKALDLSEYKPAPPRPSTSRTSRTRDKSSNARTRPSTAAGWASSRPSTAHGFASRPSTSSGWGAPSSRSYSTAPTTLLKLRIPRSARSKAQRPKTASSFAARMAYSKRLRQSTARPQKPGRRLYTKGDFQGTSLSSDKSGRGPGSYRAVTLSKPRGGSFTNPPRTIRHYESAREILQRVQRPPEHLLKYSKQKQALTVPGPIFSKNAHSTTSLAKSVDEMKKREALAKMEDKTNELGPGMYDIYAAERSQLKRNPVTKTRSRLVKTSPSGTSRLTSKPHIAIGDSNSQKFTFGSGFFDFSRGPKRRDIVTRNASLASTLTLDKKLKSLKLHGRTLDRNIGRVNRRKNKILSAWRTKTEREALERQTKANRALSRVAQNLRTTSYRSRMWKINIQTILRAKHLVRLTQKIIETRKHKQSCRVISRTWLRYKMKKALRGIQVMKRFINLGVFYRRLKTATSSRVAVKRNAMRTVSGFLVWALANGNALRMQVLVARARARIIMVQRAWRRFHARFNIHVSCILLHQWRYMYQRKWKAIQTQSSSAVPLTDDEVIEKNERIWKLAVVWWRKIGDEEKKRVFKYDIDYKMWKEDRENGIATDMPHRPVTPCMLTEDQLEANAKQIEEIDGWAQLATLHEQRRCAFRAAQRESSAYLY